jgi:hypothetical protein
MKDITQFSETAPNSLLSYTKEAEEEIKNEFGDAVALETGEAAVRRLPKRETVALGLNGDARCLDFVVKGRGQR